MNFVAYQQNVDFMQLQQRAMPFGGCGSSGPTVCSPQPSCFPLPQPCLPNVNGGNYLAETNFFWSQCMQAQQSLFQGWQQFCGCQSSGPQWGGQGQQPPHDCQPPQWGNCQPPEIHIHHHYVHHDCPQPVPGPPISARPSAPALTRTMPPLPKPPAQVASALPTPSRRPFLNYSENSGSRVYGSAPNGGGTTRLTNGQTIEEVFANPFAGTDMGYLQEAIDKIQAARQTYGAQPPRAQGQKGDLRVIAGDRADGVKPRDIRIDDANSYDWQKGENSYQENRQETRFKDGTIGREYDITVNWEDGTSTRKRVQLREAGQIVYIRSAEGY